MLVYAGLGIVWMPINPLPHDAYRYVAEIEREFEGLAPDQVLLDLGGAWLRERKGIVARDSAPCIGCRAEAPVGVGDFSGFLDRLKGRDYQKLLVRNLDKSQFWYDGHRSPRSTGIRKAIRDNYREVGRIKAVEGEKRFMMVSYEPLAWPGTRYGFEEITILVPRASDDATGWALARAGMEIERHGYNSVRSKVRSSHSAISSVRPTATGLFVRRSSGGHGWADINGRIAVSGRSRRVVASNRAGCPSVGQGLGPAAAGSRPFDDAACPRDRLGRQAVAFAS